MFVSHSVFRLAQGFYLFLNSKLFLFKRGHFKGVRRRMTSKFVNLGIKTRVTSVELTDAGFDWHGVLSFTKVELDN